MASTPHNPALMLHLSRIAIVAACAAAIAACVAYRPKPIDPAQTVEQFRARRLDDPALRDRVAAFLPDAATTWPPAAWNRAQLLAAALTLNPKLAVARAQTQVAMTHGITAGEMPNPDFTLQSEYARHDPHPWLYGLGLDLLLRSPARKRLDIEQAQLDVSNAQWDLMEQAWSVRHDLLAALSDREAAMRRADVLERLARAQNTLYDIEKRRVDAGEDSADELIGSGQARIDIEQQRVQARTDLASADAALATALGVPASAIDGLRVDWPEWGNPPPTDIVASKRDEALRSRADLSAAIGAYAVAENKLHQSILRQYPEFHFLPGYYWDHGISKYPIDVSFGLPFNRNRGEIAEATAQRDVEGARMLDVQATIVGEISAAERGEAIARDGTDAAERGFASTRKQQDQAKLGLKLGAIGAVDGMAADILALRSELEVLQMRAQIQTARNALEDALHAPLSGPELTLAHPLPESIAGATP